MRSRLTFTLAVVVAVVLAGCTGTLFATESTPATIPAAAYEPVGYVHGNTTAVPLTYTVGAAGITRNVTVTSWLSGYSRTTGENQTAALLVLSTPDVEVAGESVNPFGRMSDGVLLERVLNATSGYNISDRMSDVGELRRVGASDKTVLETPATVTTYTGTALIEERRVTALVHIVTVAHGDDVIVGIALHPESMDETATVQQLFERIEHEAESE